MIESFKHKGLKKFYDKGDRSGLGTDIAKKAELYLSWLHVTLLLLKANTFTPIQIPSKYSERASLNSFLQIIHWIV